MSLLTNLKNTYILRVVKNVSDNPKIFSKLNKYLRNNKDIATAAVIADLNNCQYLDPRFCDSVSFIESILSKTSNGHVLRYASMRLRDMEDLIRYALSQNLYSSVLEYASDRLRNDINMVRLSITHELSALRFASYAIRDNSKFMWDLIQDNSTVFTYASDRLRNDAEFSLYALKQSGYLFKYVGVHLKSDKSFVLDAAYSMIRPPRQLNIEDLIYVCNEEVRFVLDYKSDIRDQDWPIIKQAILDDFATMRHPPAEITSIIDGMPNRLLYLAQYCLTKSNIVNTEFTLTGDLI